jgi:threonine/homoserine/homoserine lactone efflux protein
MAPAHLVAFFVTAVVVILIPGPSVLFIVSGAIASGRRVAIWSVLGNSLGEYAQVIVVAFGMGVVVERSVAVFALRKMAGGLYLIYLGLKTLCGRRSVAAALRALTSGSSDRRSFREGVLVGISNPKTVVVMAAILPQVVTPAVRGRLWFRSCSWGSSSPPWQSCRIRDGRRGRSFRTWFARSPRRDELIGGAGGLAIAAVGAARLVSGRQP